MSSAASRALALVRERALPQAEQALRDAMRAEPSSGELARMLGALYAYQQRHDEALEALRRALELEPRHAAAANLAGVCHSLALRYEEALPYYRSALELDPSLTDACANNGWNSLLLARPDWGGSFREWLRRNGPAEDPAPAGGKLELGEVTLCCIDCAYHDLAARALRHSLAGCAFGDALFLSDRDCGVEGVRFVPIDRISSAAEYSNFMIHELHRHVATAYVLVIQYDGFVLNPRAWDPQFLSYDYIGAKFAVNGDYLVGNGGFSLRSAKLLRALRDDEEIRRYDCATARYHEDVAICRSYRGRLESRHGIRFAPVAIADRFAAEQTPPARSSFGFHNLIHLMGLYESGFALPDKPGDGSVGIVFRAPSELGTLSFRREIDLGGVPQFWAGS